MERTVQEENGPAAEGMYDMLIDADEGEALQQRFAEFVKDNAFPCVGAKSALAHGTLRTVVCWSIESGWDDVKMHRELVRWAHDYRKQPGLFRSLAFLFTAPVNALDEKRFEGALWERVQSLADKDAWLEQPYDSRVSSDPSDPHFSLSFGGEAFFVVGMHPHASRPARRFECPVLVFNLHDQFEMLRQAGKYEGMRDKILRRDESLAGSINPMLARHGETSEAAQYSGRLVDGEWKCPFSDPRRAS
jgi:uncharacterized protein